MALDTTIRLAQYLDDEYGYPQCVITFDDPALPQAFLGPEVARGLERGDGVFLGEEFQEIVPILKVENEDGETQRIKGFIRDDAIMTIAQRFGEDQEKGHYESGTIIFGDV